MIITALFAFISVFGMAKPYLGDSERVIEYRHQDNTYVVVVAMDGLSLSQAKKMAQQRAAEVTVEQGDRYFVIQSMEEVRIDQFSEDNYQYLGGNAYQEAIVEKNFGRDTIMREHSGSSTSYPAIQIIFTTYSERPSKNAVDACKLTNCN